MFRRVHVTTVAVESNNHYITNQLTNIQRIALLKQLIVHRLVRNFSQQNLKFH
jgi:hypothetical protein